MAFLSDPAIEHTDAIIISGDITYSGAPEEYSLVKNELINPIRDALQLQNSDIFIAPGNHDTDRSGFGFSSTKAIKGLRKEYDSVEVAELQKELLNREAHPLKNWLTFIREFYKDASNAIELNDLYQCYSHGRVGIASLNTGWSAIGEGDRETLFIGEQPIEDALQKIKDFNEKILIIHHPFDWLHPEERKLLSAKISKHQVSTIFYGHMHEFNILREASFSEDFVMKMQAGRFDLSGREKSGYSIINATHTGNLKSGSIVFRKYDEGDKSFNPWIDRCANGKMDYEAAPTNGFDREAFAEDCKIALDIFDYDLMCNVGVSHAERKRLSEIFVCPAIKVGRKDLQDEGQEEYIDFQDLKSSRDNYILIGGENSGKSTILKSLLLDRLKSQSRTQLDEIAYYFDCKGKHLPSKHRIKTTLSEIYESFPNSPLYIDALGTKAISENALLIFDGVDGLTQNCINELVSFLSEFKSPRFIISCKHATAHELTTKLRAQAKRDFVEVNIGGMKRSHLKGLIGKWLTNSPKQSSVAKEILKTVDNAGMPNNLFVYSMLLSIYERKQGHFSTYLHEADLVENFIEVIMHKHCITRERAPQYKDLLRLLGAIADEMVRLNIFSVRACDVDNIIVKFNRDISQDFQVSSYLNPLLASGVLEYIKNEEKYRFSQACFFDYAYARYLINRENNYSELHVRFNFLRFNKVIEYISAISKEDVKLLEFCRDLTELAWGSAVDSARITDLRIAAEELREAAQSDILDHFKEDAFQGTLEHEPPKEDEIDERLDSTKPLSEQPNDGECRGDWGDLNEATQFQSSLSLYARVFRAAEHVTDREVADEHFSKVLDFYQKTIALNTRKFHDTLRPIVIDRLLENSKFKGVPSEQKQKAAEQINSFLNFVIAAFPNFTVSMMTADLINSRQINRLKNKRKTTTENLEKIIISYSLCELDDIDTLEEIKSITPIQSYEYSSIIMKIIELSHMDFTLSESTRKDLLKHARSLLKNKSARKMVNDLSEISTKITSELLEGAK